MTQLATSAPPSTAPTNDHPHHHHHPRLRAVVRRVSLTLLLACVIPGALFYTTLLVAGVWTAMGVAGSDAALETADVALMADELMKIPYTFRLSRRTVRNIRANLAISIALKAAFVVAAVAAAGGANPAEVAAEAVGSLAAKQSHLGAPREGSVEPGTEEARPASHSAIVKITNRHGLHARPAARLSRTDHRRGQPGVAGEGSDVEIAPASRTVDAAAAPGGLRGRFVAASADGSHLS